jgi:hypothetical protein
VFSEGPILDAIDMAWDDCVEGAGGGDGVDDCVEGASEVVRRLEVVLPDPGVELGDEGERRARWTMNSVRSRSPTPPWASSSE